MTLALLSIEDAWPHFARRMMGNFRRFDRENKYSAEMWEDDDQLANFVRLHPGVFEARLLDGLGELAEAKDEKGLSDLSRVLSAFPPSDSDRGSLIGSTLSALDPRVGVKLCSVANWHHHRALSSRARESCGDLIRWFRYRYPGELAVPDFSPEVHDGFLSEKNKPDILPGDLAGMTPDDIEAAIEAYVGGPIEAVESRLHPGGSSTTGFLSVGQRLAQVIWEDARTLRDLHVDRHVLADRIATLIDLQKVAYDRAFPMNGDWQKGAVDAADLEQRRKKYAHDVLSYVFEGEVPFLVTSTTYMGFQFDPFHTRWTNASGTSFTIRNRTLSPELVIGSGTLALTLIRRLCFFEGNVPCRIDPETAARVLGFIK